jgi:hypothetical protein
MKSQDEYGTALHEAGHVVVARALGLKTRKMAASINGETLQPWHLVEMTFARQDLFPIIEKRSGSSPGGPDAPWESALG